METVYYKFKCEKNCDSATIDGRFISVGNLKKIILESKRMGKWKTFGKVTDFDLLISNAQTDEEYVDEDMLIPARTVVLIQRVPGVRHMPVVINAPPPPVSTQDEEHHHRHDQPPATNYFDFDFDDFGDDVFAIPTPPTSKDDRDMKINGQGQSQSSDGRGQSQCSDGRGPKTPPQGYICHRCNGRGHFIHHCPTNGDPKFDIKRAKKPPTGIPKLDGCYALNEAAFSEREIGRMPCTHSVVNLPRCPCCKQMMKDAVLTSKCCFESFCYTCIRDHIISKSMCVCGATNIVADDLLPNLTLREAVDRVLESSGHLKRKRPEISEGTHESLNQQVRDNNNNKKKKKICNAKNYMMPFGPASFTPYWTSIPS